MQRLERVNQSVAGSYAIVSGMGLLENEIRRLQAHRDYHGAFLVVDERVMLHHRDRIQALMTLSGSLAEPWVVPSGEASKSVDFWQRGMDAMLESRVSRKTPVIAVGGGVTGDLAGFMAATALRGVPLIHVPTTLLAMVDSSVGGKTGINHSTGKNLIGAFHTPDAVIQDMDFLKTLPAREWVNGLSEVLKSGLIADMALVREAGRLFGVRGMDAEAVADASTDTSKRTWGHARIPDWSVPEAASALQQWIFRCAGIKCDITTEDEFESGRRAYLNFGHTLGHALEKLFHYESLRHGEAVYLGMMAALYLSSQLYGTVDASVLEPFRPLYPLHVDKEEIDEQALLRYMASDKKRDGATVRFVLLEDWEKPCLRPVDKILLGKAVDVVRRTL